MIVGSRIYKQVSIRSRRSDLEERSRRSDERDQIGGFRRKRRAAGKCNLPDRNRGAPKSWREAESRGILDGSTSHQLAYPA